MASAHDVAKYILKEKGAMSAWKLQKLVYYSQAWHLAWEDEPLFDEPIEAWANGPVVRTLYNVHRGRYTIGPGWRKGSIDHLTGDQRDSVDVVLGFYGKKSGHWLSELTHQEDPWRNAREGVEPGHRSTKRITHAAMKNYYASL